MQSVVVGAVAACVAVACLVALSHAPRQGLRTPQQHIGEEAVVARTREVEESTAAFKQAIQHKTERLRQQDLEGLKATHASLVSSIESLSAELHPTSPSPDPSPTAVTLPPTLTIDHLCYTEGEGGGVCWYNNGVCSDGERVVVLARERSESPHDAVVVGPAIQGGLVLDHATELWVGAFNYSHIVPPGVPDVFAGALAPEAEKRVEWVESLVFARAPPATPANVFFRTIHLAGPILAVAKMKKMHMVPSTHAEALALWGPRDRRLAVPSNPPVRFTDHLVAAVAQAGSIAVDESVVKGSEEEWVCAKKATIAGVIGYTAVRGMQDHKLLLEAVCEYIGVKSNCDRLERAGSPVNVLVLDHVPEHASRSFGNLDELVGVVKKYEPGVKLQVVALTSASPQQGEPSTAFDAPPCVYSTKHPSQLVDVTLSPHHDFGVLAQKINNAHVIVVPRSSSAMLAVMMRALAVVIEIGKLGRGSGSGYARVASTCGQHYYDVRERKKETDHGRIEVPLEEFEVALTNALEMVGLATNKHLADLLVQEGVEVNEDGSRPVYPSYARDVVEPQLIKHGQTWEEGLTGIRAVPPAEESQPVE